MATFSCLQRALVSVLHLLFLFFVSIVMLWRKIKLNRNSAKLRTTTVNMDSGRFLLPSIKAGFLYNATFVSCINLALAYLLVVFWGMAYGWKKRWFYLISLDSAAVLQVVAWSTMSCIVNNIRREGREKFSTFLRMWWAFSFLISAGSFCWNVFLLRHSVTLLLDAWVDMLAFPVGTFLFIVAIYGKTGIHTFSIQDTTEHLLTGVVPGEEAVATVEEVAAYATAGFFSRATFSWMASLLSLGYKKSLVLHDIPQLLENDSVEAAYRVLKINWDMMKEGKPSSTLSILRCLLQSFWKGAALNACFAGVSSCASFVGPYFIDDFVEYLGGKHRFMHEGYVWASVFFGAKIVQGFSQSQWYFGIQQWGLRVRTALTSLIYRKGMSLSSHSFQKHTVGEVINYMSVDVDRIGQFTWYLHDTWLLPIRISLALCILYKNLGLVSLVALGCTTIAVFVNLPLARIQEKFQEMVMGAKDVRMKATSEVLRNMRALKMQAWEIRYLEKLQYLRKVEYGWLQKFLYTNSGVVALFWGAPMFTAVVTFGTCVLIGVPLTTGRVLSVLATFRVIQEPINNLPDLVSMAIQTKVSLDRLSSFLQEQELQSDAVDRSARNMKDMAIEIEEASFSWDIPAEIPTLVGINLQIRSGIRVAVCGVVGSGKSSLLSCILGEIPRLSGSVRVHGSRAYVAQSAWIQSGKIEENILFGSPMDRVKYEDVLQACALQKDLEQFTHGDQTLIGERGINLSGGQKQRIQLARAIYHDADIYVLDDPFSAVDAQTAAHLFKECILRALGAKTVVYVTHQMEFLPAADLILVLRDGRIAQAGKYSELLEADTDFRIQLGAHNNFLETFDLVLKTENYMQDNNHLGMSCENQELEKQDSEIQQNEDALQKVKIVEGMAKEITEKKTPTQIVQEEERETGTVSLLVYQSYITAIYRGALAIVVLLGQIMFQLLQIASAYWIAWASPLTFNENPSISSAHLILVYMMLALGGSFCVLIRAVLVSTIALLTAQKFFMDMLQCIFHAPMSFFDATPSGRILSRASTDQSTLDFEIPDKLAGLVSTFTQLLGIVVIMSQVAWQVLALFIPVTITCVWLQRYYLTTSRELARLEGIHKSPVIHHFGESISGGPTIRGFDRVACFMETNFQLINSYARPFFYNFAAFEWLGLRLDLLTNFVFAFSLLLIVSLPKGTIDPSKMQK